MHEILTLASAIKHHDRLVLAVDTREAILRFITFVAVARTGTTVSFVKHVVIVATPTPHRVLFIIDVLTRRTVERTL